MNTATLEETVRQVLPALNLNPSEFKLPVGFVIRSQHSGKPRSISLNTIEQQLVFMGARAVAIPDTVALNIGAEALAFLPSRDFCERLIIAWTDLQDKSYAAAFAVSDRGALTLLGVSWSPPESWHEPMIDASRSPRNALEDALSRVQEAVRNRNTDQLDRACRLVDVALRLVGGEGQSKSVPAAAASAASWSKWENRYTLSIQDEWDRATGSNRGEQQRTADLAEDGPLGGLRVFISYARPDAATLAWPVRDALQALGASVWFDQEQIPTEAQLNLGLADTIASCDAYVLCASDEFFERAGYATQELVWAMQQHASSGKPASFLVVTQSEAILPSTALAWPRIVLRNLPMEALASDLVSVLGSTVQMAPRAPLSDRRSLAKPLLPDPPDSNALWLRAQHVRYFDELDADIIARLATGDFRNGEDKRMNEVRQRLLRIGQALNWSGTLQDIDDWPADPLVRDARLRMVSGRAVASTRWPLSGMIDGGPIVDQDIEYLATRSLPVIDWPVVAGWDDFERRLALRYHAGLLRILQELLRRGLFGGILSVPSSTIDMWEKQLSARRRECFDVILSLRSSGLLAWHREPVTWDAFFRCWSKLLAHAPWREPVPFAVLQLLIANAIQVAASAAETGWYASRYGGFAKQAFALRSPDAPSTIEVYASAGAPSKSWDGANDIRLGLIAGAAGAELRLAWPTGESSAPAPDRLRSVFDSS